MRWTLRFALAVLVFSLGVVGASAAHPSRPDSFAVTNARVFDGTQVIPSATVVVLDGRIAAVGANVIPPQGIPVIDGAGSTLMPGLIDSHAHAWTRLELERAAHFGVTTELDMWSSPRFVKKMTKEQEKGGAFDRADIFSAISPATLPEGYPYFLTPDIIEKPTLSTPEEADGFVDKRVKEGSHHLKIMLEDENPWFPIELPVLSRATVEALTQAAHDRNILAVAHVTEQYHAYDLLFDGIDGLVHIFLDEPVEPGFVQLAVQKGIFVVGTLNAEEAFITTTGGASLVADPDLAPWLTQEEIGYLLAPPIPSNITAEHIQIAKNNVRALHEAGVPILAGTDVATHGISIHRDLELLVEAGLDPAGALTGATSAAADAFGLADRGRIAPGLRADLLLVQGDPTADIKATRKIQKIWKGGVEVVRPVPAAQP